jgi:hypothetical protein
VEKIFSIAWKQQRAVAFEPSGEALSKFSACNTGVEGVRRDSQNARFYMGF